MECRFTEASCFLNIAVVSVDKKTEVINKSIWWGNWKAQKRNLKRTDRKDGFLKSMNDMHVKELQWDYKAKASLAEWPSVRVQTKWLSLVAVT